MDEICEVCCSFCVFTVLCTPSSCKPGGVNDCGCAQETRENAERKLLKAEKLRLTNFRRSSFVRSFVRSFVEVPSFLCRSFVVRSFLCRSFVRSFVEVPSFLRSFVEVPSFVCRSFLPLFLPSFLRRSFVVRRSFVRSFVPSSKFLRSFVPSPFLRSFVPLFLCSFVPLFLCRSFVVRRSLDRPSSFLRLFVFRLFVVEKRLGERGAVHHPAVVLPSSSLRHPFVIPSSLLCPSSSFAVLRWTLAGS